LALGERQPVDQQPGHRGLIARPTVGGHVHNVETGQRSHGRHRHGHGDLSAQLRQRDADELVHRARPVQPGGLVQIGVNLLHTGEEQHHAQSAHRPGSDDADGVQGQVEIAQPRAGDPIQPDQSKCLVDHAVLLIHPAPGHPDGDQWHHLGQEEQQPEQRHPAAPVAREQPGHQQPDDDGDPGEEDHQHQRMQDRAVEHRVGEDLGVVAEPDPDPQGDAVPVEQRQIRRVKRREHREGQVEHQRRQHVHIAPPPAPPTRSSTRGHRGAGRLTARGSCPGHSGWTPRTPPVPSGRRSTTECLRSTRPTSRVRRSPGTG